MIYSVWNYANRCFDYFDGPGSGTTHAGTPPVRAISSQLGCTPEQLAWPLPSSARQIGSGLEARGRVSSRPTGLLGLGGFPEIPPYLIYIGIAYAAWRLFK